MRIAFFDLETTDLKGDIGRILVGSILCHDGQMVTFRQDRIKKKRSMADDGEIARLIRDKLEEHHLTVGWYSKGFDIPFLNTRLIQNGHRRLLPMLHLDPKWYYNGWRGAKPRNAKLATVAEFFGLEEGKMDVPVEVWVNAQGGDEEAMNILVERCESDVRILRELTMKTLDAGLIKNITTYP